MSAPLGDLEQLVLLALLRLAPEAFGVAVQEEIAHRTHRAVSLGAVYTTLARLEQKGYVRATIGEPTPVRGGRRKKYYHVEPAGRRALAVVLADLKAMSAGLATRLEVR